MKIKCSLCGKEYDPKLNPACSKCPIAKNCNLVCCPNCGYQTVADSKIVRFAQKIIKKEEKK
ncbi:MAG: hypothetical protein KAS39_07325 [Actinomycetia bacterium]|nr:hypothetical protein [Actinomycetes bacterium]